jgi:hypothetical protein
MIVHLIRFKPAVYRCARCGLTRQSKDGLCEPVEVK